MNDNMSFDLNDKLRDLSVMYELVSSIGTSLDMKTELDQFLLKILKRFGYASGTILIKAEDDGMFFVASSNGFQRAEDILGEKISINHFGLDQVVSKQQPLVKNVLSATDVNFMIVSRLEKQIKSFAFLPIILEGKVLGILRLFSSDKNDFSEKTLRMLNHLLKRLGYALNHIMTLEKVRQTEEQLQQSNERLMTVLHSIDASVYVADMETYEVLFMNQSMIDDFGKDYTGEICWQVFRGESQPCEFCTNDQLLDHKGKPAGVKTWQEQNPITGKYYLNNDRAISWTNGRMARIQISTDITEIKKLEQQLRQKYKMEAVGIMAGGIAHNFNNSLAVILGNLELAQMKLSKTDGIFDFLNYAKIAAQRARDLTRQILAYSRQSRPSKKPLNIVAIIDETMDLLRATIPTTITIHKTTSPECAESEIIGDMSLIQESLINLCNNAVQAMDGIGELSLKVETTFLNQHQIPSQYKSQPGQYCRINVQDTGPGIPKEIVDKIFDPFFTTKEVGQGTGMGLATVQGIIDQHGGLIKVNTELGRGSTFELYFPLTGERQEEIPEPVQLETPQAEGKILFVDDDEMLVQLGHSLLTDLGYQVTALTSSTEALELFTANPEQFDIVISDQTMPDLTGRELIAALRKINPELPSILCTGHNAETTSESIQSPCHHTFLQKPYELSELEQTIRKVINKES